MLHFISISPAVLESPSVTFPATPDAQWKLSDESDVSKERSCVEVDLVRRAPRPVALVREHCWTSDCPEKVHPPFRSLGRADVNIEKAQWNLHVGDPQLVGVVESCASSNTVCS